MDKKSYEQSIEELSLMLMYLTRQQDNNEYCRYRELSWKGYDFKALEKLDNSKLIYQPRSKRGFDKYLYLSEEGRERAQKLLSEYGFTDKEMNCKYEFRYIHADETEQAADIEQICFPPNEACSREMMIERIKVAPDFFLVAVDKKTGKIVGFLNGLATDEYSFRDEFFTDASLHNPDGKNIMILGLDVLPEYRKQGLAREIMYQYLRKEWERDRKLVILTCLANKVKMYKKMGFDDRGIADSSWGSEEWHEMCCVLNI